MCLEHETDQDVGSGGTKAPRNLRSPSAVNQTHFRSGQKATNRLLLFKDALYKIKDLVTWDTRV